MSEQQITKVVAGRSAGQGVGLRSGAQRQADADGRALRGVERAQPRGRSGGGGRRAVAVGGREQLLLEHRRADLCGGRRLLVAGAADARAEQQREPEAGEAEREAGEVERPRVHRVRLAAHAEQAPHAARPAREHGRRAPDDEALGDADRLHDGHHSELAGAPDGAAEHRERLEGRRRARVGVGEVDADADEPDADAEAPLEEEAVADVVLLDGQVVGAEEHDRAEGAAEAEGVDHHGLL